MLYEKSIKFDYFSNIKYVTYSGYASPAFAGHAPIQIVLQQI